MKVQVEITVLREVKPSGDNPNGVMYQRGAHYSFQVNCDNIIDAFTQGRAAMAIELKEQGLQVIANTPAPTPANAASAE